jgi:mono/diheme cytochrome c family protein
MTRPGRATRLALLALLVTAASIAAAFARPGGQDVSSAQAEHVAHLLGYLDADYARFGSGERAELLAMAAEAERLARGLPRSPDLAKRVAEVGVLVERAAPSTEVHARVAALREAIFVDHHIDPSPRRAPDVVHGRSLYEQHCASCHGGTGRADTLLAATLRPHPANFCEPLFGAALSPYDVTTAIRFGVDGTPMEPVSSLDEQDRWDVGFYVLGLRHAGDMAQAVPSFTSSELALVTDDELSDALFAAGIGGANLPPTLNALRRGTAFEGPRDEPIAVARRQLDAARAAVIRGDSLAAVDAVLSAGSVRSVFTVADPALADKLGATFARLAELARSPAPPGRVLDVLGTTLGMLTYAEHASHVGLGAAETTAIASAWPVETASKAPTATAAAQGQGAPCSAPGFGHGPQLRSVEGGLAFDVTHDCMFPGNDQLEIVLDVRQPERPTRAQVDALLRGALAQVRSATGERMPELTHISAVSADGKTPYGRLELDADEGPEGELAVLLQIPFEPAEWAATLGASHSAGLPDTLRPEVTFDAARSEIAVRIPFAEPGTDRGSERVTVARAAIRLFPWLFDFYPPKTDVQAITLTGVWKGRPVVTIHVADLPTFLSMDPWPIRERMAAAGIPIDPAAVRNPEQVVTLGREYARALARLPKGSVVLDRAVAAN